MQMTNNAMNAMNAMNATYMWQMRNQRASIERHPALRAGVVGLRPWYDASLVVPVATRQRDDLRFQFSFFLANTTIHVLVICRSTFENFPEFDLPQLGSRTAAGHLVSPIMTVARTTT